MKSLNVSIHNYATQVKEGTIRFAYQGLMNYIKTLRTYFKDQYPEYNVAENFYQGYMDMSFFSLAPKTFKEKDLKIAVVFIHEHARFEVWLTGKNSTIQTEYRRLFRETRSNEYKVSPDKKGITSIIEFVLVEQPDFDNPEGLTKQIDIEVKSFIEDMEKLLK